MRHISILTESTVFSEALLLYEYIVYPVYAGYRLCVLTKHQHTISESQIQYILVLMKAFGNSTERDVIPKGRTLLFMYDIITVY